MKIQFNEFINQTQHINNLCRIFEDMTTKLITKNNIKDPLGPLEFILQTIPILKDIGINISLDKKTIAKLIDAYISIRDITE